MLHPNRLRSALLYKPDGTTEKLPNRRPPACLTCQYRPVMASEAELPSLAQQILNFGAAVARYTKSGFQNVSEDAYDQRIQACSGCSSLTSEARCTHCGCWVSEKALWSTETCPEGKWEAVSAQEERPPPLQAAIEAICRNCPAECPGPSLSSCPRDLWPAAKPPRMKRRRGCRGCH